MPEILETELKTYDKLLPTLLDRAGQFALFKGSDLIGVYTAAADALAEGYKKFGTEPFLVKQIETDQSIQYFSRDLCPA
ncbi:MAG: hypothetical protein LV480_10420 [Methylacidiphilales bacterium]|nr:hypothetical protein [Candidatus Methylacidiphilales bacterium]